MMGVDISPVLGMMEVMDPVAEMVVEVVGTNLNQLMVEKVGRVRVLIKLLLIGLLVQHLLDMGILVLVGDLPKVERVVVLEILILDLLIFKNRVVLV